MVFSSIVFLLYFLPVFLAIYLVLGKKFKNYWILIASIFFYAWGAPKFVFIVLLATSLDFYVVNQLYVAKEQHKKKWLTLSLILNLGLLGYFKYANFFIDNLNYLLDSIGIQSIAWTKIALPIGISFYIFQSITYAVDVYRKVNPPVKKLSDYLVYILLFPQLIAGPIVKYNIIAKQITQREETADKRLLGFYRFCIGLAKKVLIANVMAIYANEILDGNIEAATTSTIWIGIIAYTFQIYFDFSGYSDMAIGLGKMMGFEFPENFDSPYLSKNISEFWRRWHMTLGGFMKEYLYIPLGGNRVKSSSRLYFNLGLVFLLSGLWHGASWNFVLWGAFHGIFLIMDRLFLIKLLTKIGKVGSIAITFFFVMVGWAIFRMEDFGRMKIVLKKLFAFEFHLNYELTVEFWTILSFALLFSFITIFKFGKKLETFFFYQTKPRLRNHFVLFSISIALLLVSVASLVASDFNPFIYYRF